MVPLHEWIYLIDPTRLGGLPQIPKRDWPSLRAFWRILLCWLGGSPTCGWAPYEPCVNYPPIITMLSFSIAPWLPDHVHTICRCSKRANCYVFVVLLCCSYDMFLLSSNMFLSHSHNAQLGLSPQQHRLLPTLRHSTQNTSYISEQTPKGFLFWGNGMQTSFQTWSRGRSMDCAHRKWAHTPKGSLFWGNGTQTSFQTRSRGGSMDCAHQKWAHTPKGSLFEGMGHKYQAWSRGRSMDHTHQKWACTPKGFLFLRERYMNIISSTI